MYVCVSGQHATGCNNYKSVRSGSLKNPISVVLGTGAGASHSGAACSAPRAGGEWGGVGAGTTKPQQGEAPAAGLPFPAPSLVSFISMGSQHRADPDPPSPAKPSGPLQQPHPSFVPILIREMLAEQGSQEGNTDTGSGSQLSTSTGCPDWEKWGCLLCKSSVPPGHPLLHASPWLWGRVVGQPPALHSNLRDVGGHTRCCSSKAGETGQIAAPANPA